MYIPATERANDFIVQYDVVKLIWDKMDVDDQIIIYVTYVSLHMELFRLQKIMPEWTL